jgi:hypothetical protein
MSKNRSRKNKGGACGMNKQEGGKDKQEGGKDKQEGGKKKEGGKRKTRRMAKGPSEWNKKVMEVYRDMKKKDKSVRLGAAMKRASEMKKRGEL